MNWEDGGQSRRSISGPVSAHPRPIFDNAKELSPISSVMDVGGIKDSFRHVQILKRNARAVEDGNLVPVLPAGGGSRQHRADGDKGRAALRVLELVDAGGLPQSPGDIANHRVGVVREDRADATLWPLTGPDGSETSLRVHPVYACNDGRLIRVLPDWSLPDADIVALLNPRAIRAVRIDAFRLSVEIMSGGT